MTKYDGRFNLPVRTSQNLKLFESYFNRYMAVWQPWNEKDYIRDGFLKNAGLYSIVSRICRTAATAPFKVYRIKEQGKKNLERYKSWTSRGATKESMGNAWRLKQQVFEEDNAHELNKLIERPNQMQGGNQFVQNSIGFKLLTGNRFLFLSMLDMGANAGRVSEIYNLPPQNMRLIPGSTLWEVAGYELMLAKIVPIEKENVIHSRFWNPEFDLSGSHLWGLSPLRAATRNLTRTDAAEDRSVSMLQNAGAAGIVFAKTGFTNADGSAMTLEQAAKVKRQWNEEILGGKNAGAIGLANQELGYLNFGMSVVELAILEQEKYSQDQLCNIYCVPPGLFQSSANATDNNIQAWNKQLITQAAIPALADLRDDLNEIAKRYGDDIYIDFDASVFPELQEDQEKVARVMQMSWWTKGNEKRLAMYMDEDQEEEMMNRYLVPSGLTDISDLNPANIDNALNEVDAETTN